MILKQLPLTAVLPLFLAAPAFSQPAYLQDINVAVQPSDHQVEITVNGLMPSPCFNVQRSSLVEEFMVTVSVEIRFPDGVSSCLKETAPFSVSSLLETPPPGEYEVQVSINGQMQAQYRHFQIISESESRVKEV